MTYLVWGCLIGILIVGFGLRIFSAYWNDQQPLGGDVQNDLKAGEAFLANGTFQIQPPSEEPFYYSLHNGRFLDQHPILLPLLGASLPLIAGPDTISVTTSAQFFSLISGLALIVLAFMLGKMTINQEAGLVMAAFVSISYILIDFSVNASLYMLQAALSLLWVVVVFRSQNPETGELETSRLFSRSSVFFLALIAAMAFMLTYLAISIALATGLTFLLLGTASWRQRLQACVLFSLLFIIFTLPLTIRNTVTFGSPLYSINMIYIYQRAGLPETTENGLIRYQVDLTTAPMIANALTRWSIHNFYYLHRKLFILLPVFYFFLMFAIVDYLFSRKLATRVAPVLILLTFYLLFTVPWPLIKFRYFAPLLPLVLFLSCEYIYRSFQGRTRLLVVSASLACTALLSFATYFATAPIGHTYYSDGAITSDPYGDGPDGQKIWSPYRPQGE